MTIDKLIEQGKKVLATKFMQPNFYDTIKPYVDNAQFSAWEANIKSFIFEKYRDNHPLYKEICKKHHGYSTNFQLAEQHMALLETIKQKIESEEEAIVPIDKQDILVEICTNFDAYVQQLKFRHDNRIALEIKDEYDVQDSLHAILRLFFKDIREEEYTPSYCGRSSRIDFLLENEKIAIEVKMTRTGLKDKEIGEQLTEDIARYRKHASVKNLYCLIYDPNKLLKNPAGIKGDVEQDQNLKTHIFISR